jgi:hypothetical protein
MRGSAALIEFVLESEMPPPLLEWLARFDQVEQGLAVPSLAKVVE